MVGRMLAQLTGCTPKTLKMELAGVVSSADASFLSAGVLDGVLSYRRIGTVSPANLAVVAKRHGVSMETLRNADAREYASMVSVSADDAEVAVTLYGAKSTARIVSLLGYKIDIAPAKQSLVFEYVDKPGRIGVIGTVLGDNGVNISTMQIGTKPEEQCALVYMNVDGDITQDVLDQLHAALELKNLWYVSL